MKSLSQCCVAYCMLFVLYGGMGFAHNLLSGSVGYDRLAGLESAVLAGKDAGPFILLNSKSGLCIQPPRNTSAPGQLSQPDYLKLVLLPDGCNISSPYAQFLFTADGEILHSSSGTCMEPAFAPGEGHPFPSVLLKNCSSRTNLADHKIGNWRLTTQASLVHTSSGMCLHPSGGQAQSGVSLHLHRECNKDRLEFTQVPTERVSPKLQPMPSEDRLDLQVGRKQSQWPAPLCCAGTTCLIKPRKQRRNTFLTTARSGNYVQAVKGLACSLSKSNPGSHLVVMGALTDIQRLATTDLEYLKHNASLPGLSVEYITVEDIDFPNHFNPRFHLNWIKLRAWNLTAWDAIIMLDADMAVVGDLRHLFGLPHHYASALEQAPGFPWNAGGFKFLRPCRAVFEHMLALLSQYQGLQFRDKFSEQTFLDWYFRYDAINLPFTYHANAHQHPDLRTHGTVTGLQPILLHFADKKPWEIPEDDVLHRYAHPCNDTFPTQLVLPSSSHVYATSLARARLHNRRHHKRSANGRLMNR